MDYYLLAADFTFEAPRAGLPADFGFSGGGDGVMAQRNFSPEVRAVRMVFEQESRYGSRWEPVRSIAEKIGCSAEALRKWVQQSEIVVGQVAGQEFWRVQGHAKLERLVYGESLQGLPVKAGPVPLQPDHAYYVIVKGDSAWGREAWGRCTFFLDQAGRVQTEPGC